MKERRKENEEKRSNAEIERRPGWLAEEAKG